MPSMAKSAPGEATPACVSVCSGYVCDLHTSHHITSNQVKLHSQTHSHITSHHIKSNQITFTNTLTHHITSHSHILLITSHSTPLPPLSLIRTAQGRQPEGGSLGMHCAIRNHGRREGVQHARADRGRRLPYPCAAALLRRCVCVVCVCVCVCVSVLNLFNSFYLKENFHFLLFFFFFL